MTTCARTSRARPRRCDFCILGIGSHNYVHFTSNPTPSCRGEGRRGGPLTHEVPKLCPGAALPPG